MKWSILSSVVNIIYKIRFKDASKIARQEFGSLIVDSLHDIPQILKNRISIEYPEA